MAKRSRLSQNEVISVMRAIAEIAAHRHQPALQRKLLIDQMTRLVGATIGFAYVCDGWKDGMEPRFLDAHLTGHTAEVFDFYLHDVLIPFTVRADPYCDRAMSRTDTLDRLYQQDVLNTPDALDKYGPYSAWGHNMNLIDGAVTWGRLDGLRDGAMIGFALHRMDDDPVFTNRDRAMIDLAMEEVYRLTLKGYYSLPEFTEARSIVEQFAVLPPRLRQVLRLVLAGRHVKGIALDLNLSVHTVREHLQRLYRHFNVTGREELMAKFIDGERASPDPPPPQ